MTIAITPGFSQVVGTSSLSKTVSTVFIHLSRHQQPEQHRQYNRPEDRFEDDPGRLLANLSDEIVVGDGFFAVIQIARPARRLGHSRLFFRLEQAEQR